MFVTQEKKGTAREEPGGGGGGRPAPAPLLSTGSPGLTLLQAACILSRRCSESLSAEQRTEWGLAPGLLLAVTGDWFLRQQAGHPLCLTENLSLGLGGFYYRGV